MSVIERVREQHPALKLRGLTRNPDSSASQLLKAKGVEMVAGDMSDEESLVAAFKVRRPIDHSRARLCAERSSILTVANREPQPFSL